MDELLDLRTMHVGADHLIVAARVAFRDEIGADRAEDVADERFADQRCGQRGRVAALTPIPPCLDGRP